MLLLLCTLCWHVVALLVRHCGAACTQLIHCTALLCCHNILQAHGLVLCAMLVALAACLCKKLLDKRTAVIGVAALVLALLCYTGLASHVSSTHVHETHTVSSCAVFFVTALDFAVYV